jgi:hypothetical protein
MVATIAFWDWRIGFDVSLGPLYTLPMILLDVTVPPRLLVVMALFCAALQMLFFNEGSTLETRWLLMWCIANNTTHRLILGLS